MCICVCTTIYDYMYACLYTGVNITHMKPLSTFDYLIRCRHNDTIVRVAAHIISLYKVCVNFIETSIYSFKIVIKVIIHFMVIKYKKVSMHFIKNLL